MHVPAGAIPKDGPSAGIAMSTALVLAAHRTPVRGDVAMTGEITLRGQVLPVGGIKEKVLAAHRAGIRRVVLPERNQKDLVDIPEEVKRTLEIVFVRKVGETLVAALEGAEFFDLPNSPYMPGEIPARLTRRSSRSRG